MSTNQNTIPGMIYPTKQAMSAGTPAASAMANMKGTAMTQASANKGLAGGKIKRSKRRYNGGGASDGFVVPQYQIPYTVTNGTGTGPNSQIKGGLETSTQMGTAGNAKYDAYASVKGGSRRRKGGNPDWNWGCMSGGKKRKSRKHSRRNKHKKSRKSRTYRKY